MDNSVNKLKNVANSVKTFTDADQCTDFLTKVADERCSVISECLNQSIISPTEDVTQV